MLELVGKHDEFSGSSVEDDRFVQSTFRKVLDGDVVELILLFHDELLLVDLDDGPLAPPCETEFAEESLRA